MGATAAANAGFWSLLLLMRRPASSASETCPVRVLTIVLAFSVRVSMCSPSSCVSQEPPTFPRSARGLKVTDRIAREHPPDANSIAKRLEERLVEGGQIVGFARRDQGERALVDDELAVDPLRARVAEVRLEAR